MFPSKVRREMPQRYRLEASKCKKCGKMFYPPRLICDACGSRKFDTEVLPELAKLVTYTVIRTPASQFSDQAPYAMGIVEFANGVKMMGQIADCDIEKLKTGMDMRLEFRKIQVHGTHGVLSYSYKFIPKWY